MLNTILSLDSGYHLKIQHIVPLVLTSGDIMAHMDIIALLIYLAKFLWPRHKMAEGHIEFTLSVCVCVRLFQILVRLVTSLCMVGFKNNLAQMIIKTGVSRIRTMSVGQRSRSQLALKNFAF